VSDEIAELMFKRGKRDGLAGLNMSSTSEDYRKGWIEGRREWLEEKLRYRDLEEGRACKH